jgi:hypothetical protein
MRGPTGVVEAFARTSEDRKPRPGMAKAAAAALNLDLTASPVVGNRCGYVHLREHWLYVAQPSNEAARSSLRISPTEPLRCGSQYHHRYFRRPIRQRKPVGEVRGSKRRRLKKGHLSERSRSLWAQFWASERLTIGCHSRLRGGSGLQLSRSVCASIQVG